MFSMNDNIFTASPSASPRPFRIIANGGAVVHLHNFCHITEGNGEESSRQLTRLSLMENAYLSYYQLNMQFFAANFLSIMYVFIFRLKKMKKKVHSYGFPINICKSAN